MTFVGVFEDPEGTEEEILAATYRSLIEHGYAELSIKKIGEELGTSPSLVYHHFENKDDLVLACLEYMLQQFTQRMTADGTDTPAEDLGTFLDNVYSSFTCFDEIAPLVDLRSQSIHDEEFRAYFSRSDAIFRSHLGSLVEQEIQAEDSTEVEAIGNLLLTLLIGSIVRSATTRDEDWIDDVRSEIDTYVASKYE